MLQTPLFNLPPYNPVDVSINYPSTTLPRQLHLVRSRYRILGFTINPETTLLKANIVKKILLSFFSNSNSEPLYTEPISNLDYANTYLHTRTRKET